MKVELQGRLLKVSGVVRTSGSVRRPVPRGNITRFTSKSRKRLLELCNRLSNTVKGRTSFLTVTYPWNMQDTQRAKRDLKTLVERLKRLGVKSILWRMEYQKRGAIHFHMVLFGTPFLEISGLRDAWREIIGATPDQVIIIDIRLVRGSRQLLSYVSKYLAKSALLDTVPYLRGAGTGRWWGVYGRKYLPLDDLFQFETKSMAFFWKMRRYARKLRRMPHLWSWLPLGFTLFVDNTDVWLKAVYELRSCDGGL